MKLKTWVHTALRTALRALTSGGVSAVILAALLPLVAQAGVVITGPNPCNDGTDDVYVKFTLDDNTTASKTWTVPSDVSSIRYLVVGGGGGGGSPTTVAVGGGGAGGFLDSSVGVSGGETLSITVGAGGAAGTNGSDSFVSGLSGGEVRAIGGGCGAGANGGAGSGGSGGGANYGHTTIGSCTANQGNVGGANANGAGGGGGAGSAGGAASSDSGGNGGAGKSSDITGKSVDYAGGGGGGSKTATGAAGTGGAGGGGAGGLGSTTSGGGKAGTNGTDGLGGGGGGAGKYYSGTGSRGGSGVVIIRYASSEPAYTIIENWYPASDEGNGQTRTIRRNSDGQEFKVVKFTSTTAPISWTVPSGVTAIDYLVVGGGGAGMRRNTSGYAGGGGGAGGLLQGTRTVSAGDVLTLTVGKGGVQLEKGGGRTGNGITSVLSNGGDSVVKTNEVELLRAYGGGAGGGIDRRWGGSGGGIPFNVSNAMPGSEDLGQGHDGGKRDGVTTDWTGATGGGGAGSAGEAMTTSKGNYDGTNGGEGLPSSITGESLWYAGGGGGAAASDGTHGLGGSGVGGNAGAIGAPGKDGTGSGGGGSSGSDSTTDSGKGGSGVIVIRYATEVAEYEIVEDWTPATDAGNGQERTIRRKLDGQEFKVVKFTSTTDSISWTVPSGVTAIDYLVVGGGGAGMRFHSSRVGGGGGAGGLLQGTRTVSAGDVLTLTVGKGGVQTVDGGGRTGNGIISVASNGGDSKIKWNASEISLAYGGGGGGGGDRRWGGSGGGIPYNVTYSTAPKNAMPGSADLGQGHDGGTRDSSVDTTWTGATGGGGAGSVGEPMTNVKGKADGTNGGDGLPSSITGELLWYAGGGGGAAASGGTDGKGGSGVGGNAGETGAAGEDGTGSGGGGSSKSTDTSSGKGGSGVIVIRYAEPMEVHISGSDILNASNVKVGDVLTVGSDTVLRFTSTAAAMSWTVPEDATSIRYLVVAGGGAGGGVAGTGAEFGYGGGGAGGMVEGPGDGSDGVSAGDKIVVSVGAGGVAANGGDSLLVVNDVELVKAIGGGRGADTTDANSGGSGGGGCYDKKNYGSGTDGQGNAGGKYGNAGAGGGGANGVGQDGTGTVGGAGGVGRSSSITGSEVTYAGGGGGGNKTGLSGGAGGLGGGGGGGAENGRGGNGDDGLGGGGGGAGKGTTDGGGRGGDGVVIIRYTTQSGTPITESMITISPASTEYTGSAITPEVTVTNGTKTLAKDTDYTLSGNEAKTNVGTYKITVTGKGDYTGSASKSWKITKAENSVSAPTITGWTYGAEPNLPSGSTAKFGEVTYRYFTSDNASMDAPTAATLPGTYKVDAFVEGTANYKNGASAKVSFIISKASVAGATVTLNPDSGTWTGSAHQLPTVKVMLDGVDISADCEAAWTSGGAPTVVGSYEVTVTAKAASTKYTGTVTSKPTYTIAKVQTEILSVTMPSFKKTDASVPNPTCKVQPAAAASGVSYTYWANAECTGTPIEHAALKDQPHGVYYVKATIPESENYLGATKTASFEIIDPTVQKTPVTPPSPTSKPYNGQHQTSGIGNTPQYTVTEYAGDHIHVGVYPVTVTLTEPTTHKWADTDDSQPRMVDFTITKTDNSWNQPPSVTPTQWWEDESGTFGEGSAKWNDGAKFVKWYEIDGTTRTELDAMPTAAGSYARVVTVPGTADYNELTREVGFTIYAHDEKTPVPVPVIPDQDWTGAEQTANVPVSSFYKVTANPERTERGTYNIVTLQLNDTTHTQWDDGTTGNKTISWTIVKAKNAWTVEPELSAYVVESGGSAPTVKTAGKDKFGNVVSGTHDATKHTWTFTVDDDQDGNYEGLTKVLAYTVTGTDVAGTGDFTWNVAGSGAWTLADNWKQGDATATVYPNDAAANVTFDSASGTSSITVVRPYAESNLVNSLTVANTAPDLTLQLAGKESRNNVMHYSSLRFSDGGRLTIADNRKVRLENGLLQMYYSFTNKNHSATVSLGANAELTVNVGGAFNDYGTLAVGTLGQFSASFNASNFSMADGSRLTAEGDFTRVGFVSPFKCDTSYTLCAKDGGVIWLSNNSFLWTSATKELGSCLEAADGEIYIPSSRSDYVYRFGAGDNASCNAPKIKISGRRGRVYGFTQFGSNTNVSKPLEIILSVPAGGFKNEDIKNVNQTTIVDAPLGAGSDVVTVGSNVKFTIDLTADILARPNLSSVALIRACKADGTGKLRVPGYTSDDEANQSLLDDWYASNFTLIGVNRNEWYLYFDAAAQALHLRRKGAYEYDETAINGYTWEMAGTGDWDNAAKWDIRRVPMRETSFVRFGNGYNMEPVVVDIRNANWDFRSLSFSEPMDLTLRNGRLTGHTNGSSNPTVVRPGSKILFDNVQFLSMNNYFTLVNGSGEDKPIEMTFAHGAGLPDGTSGLQTRAAVHRDGRIWKEGDRIVVRDGSSAINALELDAGNTRPGIDSDEWSAPMMEVLVTNAQLVVQRWTQARVHTCVVGEGASFLAKGLSYNSAYHLAYDRPLIWEAVDGGHFQVDANYPSTHSYKRQRCQHFVASNGTMRVLNFTLGNLAELTESSDCLIRVGGVNGRFTAAGDLAIGAPTPKDGCTFEPTVVEIIEPAAGFANSFDTAPVQGESTVTITPQTKFKVDLSAVKAGSKFALVSGPSLAIAAADLATLQSLLEVKSESLNTDTPTLTVEDHTLYLNYAVSTKTVVNPPEIASKAYTGARQTADVPASDDYDVVSNSGGTDFGTYEVALQLKDPANKTWPDTDAATLTLPFDITQTKNSWTTEPAMNPPYWNVGNTPNPGPGTLTDGAAAFGEVSVTKSWTGELATLGEGTYTATYTVNEDSNWSGLSKTVTFYVYPQGFSPVGPKPDDEPTVYIWRNPNGGYWTVTNDWACARPGCYGYPANAQATAQFTEQYFGEDISVRGLANVSIAELDYTANVRAHVTLDFEGYSLTAAKAVFASAKGQTFAGGTFTFNAVDFAADRVSVTAEKGATVQFPSAALTLQKGELLTADNATIEFRQLTQIGHKDSQDYQPVLTMKGAAPLIKNSSTSKATTIGLETASPTSPKLVYELPAAGFTAAPLQGAQTLTIKNDVFLDIDARALVQPDGGTEATYPLASAGTLTCDAVELAKRATIRLPLNTTYELVKSGNELQLKVTWHNSGMTYTASDFEGPYDGAAHGITVTVTTPSDATIKYRTEPSGEYTLDEAPTRTEVGTTTVYFQITRDGWTPVEGSKTITITKPQYRTKAEGGKLIEVDPDEMRKLLGTEVAVSDWKTKFQEVNAAGVARWEAYVLGVDGEDAWRNLSMIITQGAATQTGLTLTVPADDFAKLAAATQRLVSEGSGERGVKSVRYELIGGKKSDGSDFEQIDASETPSFFYNLGEMNGNVQFFKIRRVYDFTNQ